ncbi:MAG TPA: hypothetical protein VG095_09770, partial [Chthoniobacterales bacterium]|nr:hypothetical protein [Chthoniobacterales bacterium]
MSWIRAAAYLVVLVMLSAQRAEASGPWFEAAPPTLPFYLHRLPAKTLKEIAEEVNPPPSSWAGNDYQRDIQDVVERVGTEPPASLVPRADELLRRLRREPEWPANNGWFGGPPVANLLHDLRDLLAANPAAESHQISDYMRWRIEHATHFGIKGAEPERYQSAQPPVSPKLAAALEQRSQTASPPLVPHWLYLRGALLFRNGNASEAQTWFGRVVNEHASSPRAEAALFMMGRCQISRARDSEYLQSSPVLVADQVPRAEELLRSYLAKY